MPVGTAQFGQADLSKTETYTEAPMTQLGRAAASNAMIDYVWLPHSGIINYVWFVSFSVFTFN